MPDLLPLFLFCSLLVLSSELRADECGAVAGNLVPNCGFEAGTFSDWTLAGVQSTPAFLGLSHGVDNADAHTGSYGAYLGGFGGVLQLFTTIATVPGTRYQISYWLAQAPATVAPYRSSFTASFAGVPLMDETDVPEFPFRRYTFAMIAPGSLSLLSFGAQDDTGFFSLDDLSVVPVTVPEPRSLFTTLAALAIAGCRLRKRQAVRRSYLA